MAPTRLIVLTLTLVLLPGRALVQTATDQPWTCRIVPFLCTFQDVIVVTRPDDLVDGDLLTGEGRVDE